MQHEFRALLTGSAAVTDIAPADRINWGVHPQGVPLPGIVLNLISNADGLTMQGPDGLWQGRVQVDAYADSYAVVAQLSQAVTELLRGYKGGGFRLIALARQNDEHETGASDRPFRISTDFMTHWRRSNG